MVCVITGASSGIGRAAALALHKSGVELVLSGRNRERLGQVAGLCNAKWIAGDVSDPAHADELFSEANGEVSAVFAAGIAAFGPTEEMPQSSWEQSVATNLTGLYYCNVSAIKAMLPLGGGRIVNVLSIASTQPFPRSAAYVASKHGALGLTRSLSAEFRSRGIRMTAFIPGSTNTPLWAPSEWKPDPADMLDADDVGAAIAEIVLTRGTGNYDEVVYMPPKGIL
jgi:NAD(P)-dependent dehydrogenase (short-subunit alcohol dehydrogenase family)